MIRRSIDPPLCNEQAGFWKCKSCSDHIFTQRQIVEQSKEWNTTLYETFIDLEKPFDSVHRESLWRLFRHYGISSKILNIIRMLYSNLKAKVICGPQLSENLSTKTGVKQGCILSPFLFNFWWLVYEENNKVRKKWYYIDFNQCARRHKPCRYLTIWLLSQRHSDMQQKFNDLNANENGLTWAQVEHLVRNRGG